MIKKTKLKPIEKDYIFKEKELNKITTKVPLAKMLMRVLKTYGEQYTVSNDPEVIEFNLSIIDKIKKLKTNNYNMKEDIC